MSLTRSCFICVFIGEFVERVKNVAVLKGERAERVIHKDTLKLEGAFSGKTSKQEEFKKFSRGERAEIVKREDHLKMEGECMGRSGLLSVSFGVKTG